MKTRYRAALWFILTSLLLLGSSGLWLRAQQRKYALNRQLIAALVHNDTKQALALVHAGADPNTPYASPPPPTFKGLLQQLLHRAPLPANDSPTALLVACGFGQDWLFELPDGQRSQENTELVQAMLAHYADLRPQMRSKETGLETALLLNHPHVVTLLLEHGANVDQPNGTGVTPLINAAWQNNSTMVSILLAHRAKVNAQDTEGETALYWAVWYERDKRLIRQLVAHGADPNILNTAGMSALAMAQQQQRSDIVTLLKHTGK